MSIKICYYFDTEGFYGGKGEIPLIRNEHPLPSSATWTEPEIPENHFAVWDQNSWVYTPYPKPEATIDPIGEQGDD